MLNHYRELYFIENTITHNIYFLYGLSAECEYDIYSGKPQRITIKKKKGKSKYNFVIIKDVVESQENTVLNVLQERECFIFVIEGNEITIPLIKRPPVYQLPKYTIDSYGLNEYSTPPESFTEHLSITETFWTIDKIDYLTSILSIDNNQVDFDSIFTNLVLLLKEKTGLSFDRAYSGRIGNYEHFTFPILSCNGKIKSETIMTKADDDKKAYSEGIKIMRSGDFIDKKLTVNIILKNNHDILIDKIVVFGNGEETIEVKAQEPISQYEMKIYENVNGSHNLILDEGYGLIRSIHMNMQILENSSNIHSKISDIIGKKISKTEREEVQNKINKVNRIGHLQPIIIENYKQDPWNPAEKQSKKLVKDYLDEPEHNWWFPTGALEETECFQFLKSIINNSNNKEVIIVDPYFSALAFTSFVPRIEILEAEYFVLTCIHPKDVDTDEESDVKTERQRIVKFCNENIDTFMPNIKLVNAVKSKDVPLFHDRYIITKDNNENISVYSLSNSLNRTAGLYPMCIVRLETPTARKVYSYIIDLLSGRYYDANGDPQDYEPDIIWERKSEQQNVRSIERSGITDKGPEDYPCWFSFWGQFFNNDNKTDLIKILQENGFIKEDEDKLKWSIESDKFTLLFKNKITVKEPDNISEFMVGFGESLARTHYNDNFEKTITSELKKNCSDFYKPEILSMVVEYYKNNRAIINSNDDIAYSTLFRSSELNYDLVDNCLHAFERFRYGRQFWGITFFIMTGIFINPVLILNWLSDQNDFIQLHSIIISTFINKLRTNADKDILFHLLKSDKPIFKALGCSALIIQLKHDEKYINYNFPQCVEILKSSGIKQGDIVWILAMRTPSFFLGRNTDRENKELYNNYLLLLSDIYKDSLDMYQIENLIKALSREELLFRFSEIVIDKYDDREKVLFLWESCVNSIKKKLDKDNVYIGIDESNIIEIGAKSFININSFENIYSAFIDNYDELWSQITRSINQHYFKNRNYSLWYDLSLKSLYLLYFSYILLIFEFEIEKEVSEELEYYVISKLNETAPNNIKNNSYHQGGFIDDLVNLITHFYQIYGKLPVKSEQFLKKIIIDRNTPLYMRLMFICTSDKFYNNHKNIIIDSIDDYLESEKDDIDSILTFLDNWIYISYRNGFIEKAIIEKVKNKIFLTHQNIPKDWKKCFDYIILALAGDKDKKYELLAEEKFSTLRSYSLLKEQESEE